MNVQMEAPPKYAEATQLPSNPGPPQAVYAAPPPQTQPGFYPPPTVAAGPSGPYLSTPVGQPGLYSPPAVVHQPVPNPVQPGLTTVVINQPETKSAPTQSGPIRCGSHPTRIVCPHCDSQVVTTTEPTIGIMAWLICGVLFFLGCWLGCCLIPFCVDGAKDVKHICPNCNRVVGSYKHI